MRNLITDVPGLQVGCADDERLRSGVTVLLPEAPAVAAIDIRGGGVATSDCDALALSATVQQVHAIVLSGGSGYGLAAATGVRSFLRDKGIGLEVGGQKVAIAPSAILFDLANGGEKGWGRMPPYEALARSACENVGEVFTLGTSGAGYGATTAQYKGGLGSASARLPGGAIVGALAVVNPFGCVTPAGDPHFWSGYVERDREFGGLGGVRDATEAASSRPPLKSASLSNTTLCVVATDITLDKAQAHRFAVMAQAGLARAIRPIHTPFDGDVVFALSTARRPSAGDPSTLAILGEVGATTLERAIARGVYEAACFGADWPTPPAYREAFTQKP